MRGSPRRSRHQRERDGRREASSLAQPTDRYHPDKRPWVSQRGATRERRSEEGVRGSGERRRKVEPCRPSAHPDPPEFVRGSPEVGPPPNGGLLSCWRRWNRSQTVPTTAPPTAPARPPRRAQREASQMTGSEGGQPRPPPAPPGPAAWRVAARLRARTALIAQ